MSERRALLAGVAVPYRLERARRRSIGFIVGAQGLVVRAPGWVTLSAIESALQEKSAWIVRKLADAQVRQARQHAARIAWEEGGALPWLGAELTLHLNGAHHVMVTQDGVLCVGLAPGASAEQVRARVQAWFQREARAHFAARLAHFAPSLGVRPARLMLTSAATRWGSASASGVIRLNWRLMHYRAEVIDYVVVHELAHLREMNHGPRFWALVQALVPAHVQLRRELRERPAPGWE